ncbi:unnamed protein product [marine sediment metagenome]|uniref:Uncharacterized protein n=1 Tax=marine sediment metagenome TaxID=412755 RepID=X1RZV1_9ZZZZ
MNNTEIDEHKFSEDEDEDEDEEEDEEEEEKTAEKGVGDQFCINNFF